MSAAATNGKLPRKQLADQIDRFETALNEQCARLDSIADALSEGLPEAVAQACREGARAAVREVLMELITNPDLMAAVRPPAAPSASVPPAPPAPPAPPPAPPAAPSFWNRVKATVKSVRQTVTGTARTLIKSIEGAVKPMTDALRVTGTTRTVVAVAVGVGLTAGAVSLVCPTWMGAVLTAGASASAVVAAHIGATVNSLFARFRFST